jgi:hypothetical protein
MQPQGLRDIVPATLLGIAWSVWPWAQPTALLIGGFWARAHGDWQAIVLWIYWVGTPALSSLSLRISQRRHRLRKSANVSLPGLWLGASLLVLILPSLQQSIGDPAKPVDAFPDGFDRSSVDPKSAELPSFAKTSEICEYKATLASRGACQRLDLLRRRPFRRQRRVPGRRWRSRVVRSRRDAASDRLAHGRDSTPVSNVIRRSRQSDAQRGRPTATPLLRQRQKTGQASKCPIVVHCILNLSSTSALPF